MSARLMGPNRLPGLYRIGLWCEVLGIDLLPGVWAIAAPGHYLRRAWPFLHITDPPAGWLLFVQLFGVFSLCVAVLYALVMLFSASRGPQLAAQLSMFTFDVLIVSQLVLRVPASARVAGWWQHLGTFAALLGFRALLIRRLSLRPAGSG